MNYKPPSFLICENPIAALADGRVFILHTRFPWLLAEVYHFNIDDNENIMKCKRAFEIGASTNFNRDAIILGCVHLFQDNKLLSLDAQSQADKLASVMRRMADWYLAYLTFSNS